MDATIFKKQIPMENIEKLASKDVHNRPQTELEERLSLRTLNDCSTALLCTLQIYTVGTVTQVFAIHFTM